MNPFPSDLFAPWMIPAAQALLHFVWQGALLAAGLALALRRLRNATASDRHALACATLALMAIAPLVTFRVLGTNGPVLAASTALVAPATVATGSAVTNGTPEGTALGFTTVPAGLLPWLPWITAFWVCGVGLSALRLLGGWWRVHRWATRETAAAPADWQERCDGLGRRLGLHRRVPLRESSRIDGPLIVGWFRPMLVLPLGMLQSLPGLQVEALLLHELAHVHGRDPLIHLLQRAVETLLFYHPAVWWVSEQVRREREHRCDDRVFDAQGQGHSLAEALVTLAERMPASEPLALAATDGSVASRVRRLLQGESTRSTGSTASRKGWLWITLALVVIALGVGLPPLALGPRLFVATARFQLDPTLDAYSMATAMERAKSLGNLADMAVNFELERRWSMDRAACVERLKDRVRISQYRRTTLLELQVACEDPKLAADLANGLAQKSIDMDREIEEVKSRSRGDSIMRLATQLAGAKTKLAHSTTNDLDGVLAASQIKVYEALLENSLRAQAERFSSPQTAGQIIDPAVPPIRRSRWSGN